MTTWASTLHLTLTKILGKRKDSSMKIGTLEHLPNRNVGVAGSQRIQETFRPASSQKAQDHLQRHHIRVTYLAPNLQISHIWCNMTAMAAPDHKDWGRDLRRSMAPMVTPDHKEQGRDFLLRGLGTPDMMGLGETMIGGRKLLLHIYEQASGSRWMRNLLRTNFLMGPASTFL